MLDSNRVLFIHFHFHIIGLNAHCDTISYFLSVSQRTTLWTVHGRSFYMIKPMYFNYKHVGQNINTLNTNVDTNEIHVKTTTQDFQM